MPSITKAREERAAAEKRKRSDNLYNMKFVRHDGILEQYNGSDSEVIIPLDVTVIGPAAFRNTSVSRIVFHENVMEIGKDAFANCGSLKSIVIPDTVKIIGEGAFRQCMNLESAVIPGSIEVLPNNLFQGCSRLSSVQCWGNPEKLCWLQKTQCNYHSCKCLENRRLCFFSLYGA